MPDAHGPEAAPGPLAANAARFAAAADLYDDVRPTPPDDLARLLVAYAGGERPRLVVDLGSGSGLSTRWAATWADRVIGIEPGAAMRGIADRAAPPNTEHRDGFAHDTGLPAHTADIVLAVQAFHWMEPVSTLAEIARLLRPGGVFAAIDCDWPPTSGDVDADRAWSECRMRVRILERRLAQGLTGDALRAPVDLADPELRDHTVADTHANRTVALGVRSWSKDGHLRRLRDAGAFAWCHELAFHRVDDSTADRFVGLLRSQGDHQTLLAAGIDDEMIGMRALETAASRAFGTGTRPLVFTYRVRLGATGDEHLHPSSRI